MFSKLRFFISLFFFIIYLHLSYAQQEGFTSDFPTPFVQGVNVITGEIDPFLKSQVRYETYREGWNAFAKDSIFLKKNDFQIGKIKIIYLDSFENDPPAVYFSYSPGKTEVLETPERASLYLYTENHLLEVVEHRYLTSLGSFVPYRRERLFWQDHPQSPQLMSRVLEDASGQALLCYTLFYNDRGQVVKETLWGNLSGNCSLSLLIKEDGYPETNGVESYSTIYQYSLEDPDLLLSQEEDNGLKTTYQYDAKTKQCTAKLKGSVEGLLSRCFYIYDEEGFLIETIVDDGQGEHCDDLKGINQRQIIYSQIGHQFPILGQTLRTETRYWDSALQQEKTLESTVYTYSEQGQIIQQDFHDANGNLRYYVHFNYDEKGQLISSVDSRGEVVLKEQKIVQPKEKHNKRGQRVAVADEYGNETTYHYDVFDRLISTQFPAVLNAWDISYHPTIKQKYNICDQVVEIIDATGEKTSMTYNSRGKPVHIIYPDQSEEKLIYFLDGILKEKTTREGTTYFYERDLSGRLVRLEKKNFVGDLLQELSYTYQGELVHTVSDGHLTTQFWYDGAGRQIKSIQETKDGKKRIEWDYDACGQKHQVWEWFGPNEEDFIVKIEELDQWQNPLKTLFKDAFGQLHYQVDHQKSNENSDFLFIQTSTVKNTSGQYVKQEERVDGYGIRHVLVYDALQRLESQVKYNSLGMKLAECHIRYDGKGHKVLEKHIVLMNGQATRDFSIRWTYDANNHLLSIIEESTHQTKTTSYQYNAQGQLKQITKPDGISLNYSYNSQGQVEDFTASDHSFSYRYSYDSLHRLIAIHDQCHHLIQTRRYNAFHELIEEEQGIGVKIGYQYDLAGRRIGLILPDSSPINYSYHGPLMTSIERLGIDQKIHYIHTYIYDINGKLQAQNLLRNLGQVCYQYNSKGNLLSIESPWWSQKVCEEGIDSYDRLLALETQDSAGQYLSHFEYTEDGQLAKENEHIYTYDSLFNRLSDNHQLWKVNSLNQLIQTPFASCKYDENGNLIEKQVKGERTFYFYDALNRLIRVEHPKKQAVSYIYDAFDRRLSQSMWKWQEKEQNWHLSSVDYWFYDGFKEIGLLNDQKQCLELRILGQGKGAEMGAAIALELAGQIFVPLHDTFGSVCCLVDAQNGSVVENYRYSTYGQETFSDADGQPLTNSVVGNPWRFCSKRIDKETGFAFFGKRYYDPSLGRWITPDPLFFHDTPNLYAFAKNDPVNYYDPYGLFSISEIWGNVEDTFFRCFRYFQSMTYHFKSKLNTELKIPPQIGEALEKVGKVLFGENTYRLMGNHFEDTQVDSYGQKEINPKVRVTFINGILTTRKMMQENLEVISQSHGGVKVHYVFRPTEGWTWDISRAVMIRTAFMLGFRSMHAHLLAKMWRELIQEMGGVNEGGIIMHYAHSLGGSETDRARDLLSPEEQRMIRIVTFGTATLVRSGGFQSVVNIVSINDGVSSFLLEPLGHLRNYFDPDSNVRFHGSFWGSPGFPRDHFLTGPTYRPILYNYGNQFLAEFNSI